MSDIGEPVDNFTSVIDVAFSNDIECAVMTFDHLAFLHCEFCSHSYCFEHFSESPHLQIIVKISALRGASTVTPAVTSRAHLHRFADKRHSPEHSEVHNSPVTKISCICFFKLVIYSCFECEFLSRLSLFFCLGMVRY